MPWRSLRIQTKPDHLGRLEALLRLAGAESICLSDAADAPLLEPAPGTTPLWPTVVLEALFPSATSVEAVAAMIKEQLADSIEVDGIAEIGDADWGRAMQQTSEPIAISERLVIVAADADDRGGNRLPLYMGLAFGTGRHATTRLCLEWLAEHLAPGSSVLDYGCGSGILALAALKLGADRAWATDDDPQAIQATRDNADLNQMSDAIWVGPPAELPDAKVDVVLANILSGPLLALAPSLASRQFPAGRLVLSGLLAEQVAEVKTAYAPYYGAFTIETRDGWCRLTGVRNA